MCLHKIKSRFFRNFREISTVVKIFEKSGFGSKFSKKKNSILLEIFTKKIKFWWKFTKNPEFDRNFENHDFFSKFSKISNLV